MLLDGLNLLSPIPFIKLLLVTYVTDSSNQSFSLTSSYSTEGLGFTTFTFIVVFMPSWLTTTLQVPSLLAVNLAFLLFPLTVTIFESLLFQVSLYLDTLSFSTVDIISASTSISSPTFKV